MNNLFQVKNRTACFFPDKRRLPKNDRWGEYPIPNLHVMFHGGSASLAAYCHGKLFVKMLSTGVAKGTKPVRSEGASQGAPMTEIKKSHYENGNHANEGSS